MMKECNLVEFFSGIGSQAKALKNLNVKVNTLGTSEWDIHAIAAYDLIHNSADIPENILVMEKGELLEFLKGYTFSNSGKSALEFRLLRTYSRDALQRIYASITRNKNFVDISALNGEKLPGNIDILTYSFPCQDLSNVGAFHGYNKGIDKDSGSRSSLLWQVGCILTEMQAVGTTLPRFLLMENVPALLSKRHIKNFQTWIRDLENLGYISKYFQLNASSFGLPQNRPRLFMISVHVGQDLTARKIVEDYLEKKDEPAVVADYRDSSFYREYKVQDLLRINYSDKKIFTEAVDCTPNDTVSRRKIWDDNPQIILPGYVYNEAIDVIRTITTKQDRNPNSGNLYFDSCIEGRSKFRYLTPRECLLFMGFTDEDYGRLKNNNVEFHKGAALFARDKIIRMAGNSIPVKLLEGIFLQILQIDDILSEYNQRDLRNLNDNYSREEYSALIRSYLFSRGIRSRRNNKLHPENAFVVYPKYKTAIYLKDYFLHGQLCTTGNLPKTNGDVSNSIVSRNASAVVADGIHAATDIGWNALLIRNCELQPDQRDETLAWIESSIRDNCGVETETGKVLIRG